MGSQDQHRQNEPQTSAEAYAKAAELKQQADAADQDDAFDIRQQAADMRRHADDLKRQERRAKNRADSEKVEAALTVRRASRLHPIGGDAA
ncbi:hypothetical protein [Streptomyces coelicoflavus]|uniref:hypothetical protein n=1 Tax=Streptomyces coelicoflavus TaxID=285562 RepID=UPI000D59A1AB|nr:hypothetical protein [Streptomyces coelicoflavus]